MSGRDPVTTAHGGWQQVTGRTQQGIRERPPRVVVTGAGVVNPAGTDRERFWKAVREGADRVRPITRFDATGLPVHLAAQVDGFRTADLVPRRIAVKSDLFTHYALAATEEALLDAGLDLADHDPFRTGICFGNNSGGWELCERGFREYYGQGPTRINPWQATAWFPTAAQGFVSIRFGIRGYSKSVACDRASGASALHHGFRSIRWGRNRIVLAGGSEAPITRLGVAAHATTGELSTAERPDEGYRPFGEGRDGLVLGEGSTVLVLEDEPHALARGAAPLGVILAVEHRTGPPHDPEALTGAVTAALRAAGRTPAEVDLVLAEGCGTPGGDAAEAATVRAVFGDGGVPVTVPRAGYGHQYGASGATEVVAALLAARDGAVPPTPGARGAAPDLGIDLVTSTRDLPVRLALITATSREGAGIAILVAPCH